MIAVLKRHPLALAVLVSLLLHLLMVWDGEFDLPDILKNEDPDQVLARKAAKTVPKVRLTLKAPPRPKAMSGVPTVTLLHDAPPPAAKPPVPQPKPPARPMPPKTASATPPPADPALSSSSDPVQEPPQTSSPSAVDALATPAPAVTATPAAEPAPAAPATPSPGDAPPAFPVELQAHYKTAIMGVSVDLAQVWRMEGNNYVIENTASKLGIRIRSTSEGVITPDGLRPDVYRVYVNNKVQRFASFDYGSGIVTYGRPDNPHAMNIRDGIQDSFSIAYQLALTYTGEPKIIQFTTGTGVFTVQLLLLGEETLKLPGGVLRTLHVRGRSIDGTAFTTDVWLAPDHLNFPAKVRVVRGNDNLELSLRTLAFEGRQVIGKGVEAEKDEDTGLPKEWLDRPEFRDARPEPSGLPGEDAP